MRILRVSLNLDVDGAEFWSSERLLTSFSHNFGNLAFVYACSSLFPGQHALWSQEREKGPLQGANYDLLLFPAANNLAAKTDMGWLADLIERLSIPTLIIGLGVQAPLGGGDIELPPGTLRFLDVVKRKNIPLGVRGALTKDFLQRQGVDDVIVTGCPSFFLNPDEDIGSTLAEKYRRAREGVSSLALNLEYFSVEAKRNQEIVRWGRNHGGAVIFQSDTRLVSLLRGDLPNADKPFASYVSKYFLGVDDPVDLRAWFSQYCRLFIHTPSWIDYLRTVSFSLGTRFHGNMLAIQAGTPALVLHHDQRTQEMAQTMGLPHYPWRDFKPDAFADIVNQISFDPEQFKATRRALAQNTCQLADRVGAPVSPHLRKLAGQLQPA